MESPAESVLRTRHRKDGVADSTSLDLRDPSFAGGVTVHLGLRTMSGGKISYSLMAPWRRLAHEWTAGWRGLVPPLWSGSGDAGSRIRMIGRREATKGIADKETRLIGDTGGIERPPE